MVQVCIVTSVVFWNLASQPFVVVCFPCSLALVYGYESNKLRGFRKEIAKLFMNRHAHIFVYIDLLEA